MSVKTGDVFSIVDDVRLRGGFRGALHRPGGVSMKVKTGDVFSIDGRAFEVTSVTGAAGEAGHYLLTDGSAVIGRTAEQLAAFRQPVVTRAVVEDDQLVLHDPGVGR